MLWPWLRFELGTACGEVVRSDSLLAKWMTAEGGLNFGGAARSKPENFENTLDALVPEKDLALSNT